MTVRGAVAVRATFAGALFDMDGVLIDTRRAIIALWRGIADDHDVVLTDEDIESKVLGCAPEHTVDTVFGFLSCADRQQALRRVVAAEPELEFDEMAGVRPLVERLHGGGVRLGLVTGGSSRRVARVLDRLDLGSAFAAVVAWGDVAHGKPAPDCYLLGADRIGLSPVECLVFEDAAGGVRAAIAAGASCVGIGAAGLAGHGARPVVAAATELHCETDRFGTMLANDGSVFATFPREPSR